MNAVVVTCLCLFHFRKFYIQQEEQQKNTNRGKKPKCLILWHSLFLLLGLYCWNVYFRGWNDWVVVKFLTQISLGMLIKLKQTTVEQWSTSRVIFVQNVHVVWHLWRGFLGFSHDTLRSDSVTNKLNFYIVGSI